MKSGLGRRPISDKYDHPLDYLNKHIFPIKDMLDGFKNAERAAEKAYQAAKNKTRLQQQKLEWAYTGLEKWRR